MLRDYDIVIGLEIHAELNTATKVFCGCRNDFGGAPNTNCCPVCVGMPGTLPVVNREAIIKTIMAGLAMDCEINELAIFERKNYFYPDLSKAYQISQLVRPICIGGGIRLASGKWIRLNRIHLEEDAGKLIHNSDNKTTLVDYNRGGIPLIEMVTEPDISSAEEAVEFLEEIRSRLIFANVANCKMEEGGMRCDVNISLKKKGSSRLGNRTEIKNLNSYKMVSRAIAYEAELQSDYLDDGKRIVTETRKWNDATGETSSMRSKEEAQDYRYFPDPDICAINIKREEVANIAQSMPQLAHKLKELLIDSYGLPAYDADIITRSREVANFFNACMKLYPVAKKISNWLMTNVLAKADGSGIKISPKQLTDIIKTVDDGKMSKNNGTKLLARLWDEEDELDALTIADEMKLIGETDTGELESVIASAIQANSNAVNDYDKTPDKVVNFFIGQIMRATKGKANSQLAKELITKALDGLKS